MPTSVPHETVRLVVPLPGSFEEAVGDYERLVPEIDTAQVTRLAEQDAPWDDILEQARQNAPHHFMIYWKYVCAPVMRLAGDPWLCNEYLMGNHTIAQRMFHHDPAIMLSAPLRTAIYGDPSGVPQFAIDQPSTRFASYGNPAITAVGRELDDHVAALLEALGAPVPAELRHGP